jgi:Uma2 family endonuclease
VQEQVTRRHFTVDEYYRMAGAGVLSEDDRVELIEGEIVEMVPIGSSHQSCVNRLTRLLVEFAGRNYVVSVQGPVRLDEFNEPQPDLALLRAREDFYAGEHPGPEDVLLLVEVSESSLAYDRNVKLPLYARFSIPEIWIVDPDAGTVEIHTDPNPSLPGGYATVRRVGRDGELRSEVVEDLTLPARAILG